MELVREINIASLRSIKRIFRFYVLFELHDYFLTNVMNKKLKFQEN